MTGERPRPAVVALGGGHGLAAALRAVRCYAGHVTAVVSVADDGGSSGRLRRELGVPPPGDLRKCLAALAEPDSLWTQAFEHRFQGGDLGGHALGNLVIAGLTATLGDFGRAVEEAALRETSATAVLVWSYVDQRGVHPLHPDFRADYGDDDAFWDAGDEPTAIAISHPGR